MVNDHLPLADGVVSARSYSFHEPDKRYATSNFCVRVATSSTLVVVDYTRKVWYREEDASPRHPRSGTILGEDYWCDTLVLLRIGPVNCTVHGMER